MRSQEICLKVTHFSRAFGAGCPPRPHMFQQQPLIHVGAWNLYLLQLFSLTIAFRCRILKFCRLTWILTRSAKSSRELRCSLRQQLFFGLPGVSVQHQILARQSQVHRSPRNRVDGIGPATEKNSCHLPSILHHTQRNPRLTNGHPHTRGCPFPSMPDHYATQTPTTTSS